MLYNKNSLTKFAEVNVI